MSDTLWIFLSNPIEVATRRNFSKAATVLDFSASGLAASTVPAVLAMSAIYAPFNADYRAKYQAWKGTGGTEEGSTQSLNTLLAGLKQDVDDWDFGVQQVFRKGTPTYTGIFPDGHAPFTKGKQQERINAVGTLSLSLEAFPALATTKAAVDARRSALIAANSAQKGLQTNTDQASAVLEASRIAACGALYKTLGGLMQYFGDTQPDQIASFFALDLIRQHVQTSFTGVVAAAQSKFIVKRSLDSDAAVTATNAGVTPLTLYFAAGKEEPLLPGMLSKSLVAGEVLNTTAAELGASADNMYLIVKNTSTSVEGHWVVAL